jgi:hypothetical protein
LAGEIFYTSPGLKFKLRPSRQVMKNVQNSSRAVKKFLDAEFAVSKQKGSYIKDNPFNA